MNVVEMKFNGAFTNHQLIGNISIAVALSYDTDDRQEKLPLTGRCATLRSWVRSWEDAMHNKSRALSARLSSA